MKRVFQHYLHDIISAIDDIFVFIEGMDFTHFQADRKTFFAVVQRFSNIGEAVKKIPGDLKIAYPKIPWRTISGMRDNLVHEYFDIENKILWMTIQNDLAVLKKNILEVLDEIK